MNKTPIDDARWSRFEPRTLKLKDTVRLVSGGPGMTVEEIDDQDALCSWWNAGLHKTQRATFRIAALVRLEK